MIRIFRRAAGRQPSVFFLLYFNEFCAWTRRAGPPLVDAKFQISNFKFLLRRARAASAPLYGIAFLAGFAFLSLVSAQEITPQPSEQFIPADQLDAVFDRDRRGVMMKRDEFKALLDKARANADVAQIPIAIITEQANISVTPGDQQATVQMELRVRQYATGWQLLRIPAGNLLVEKIEIDGQPALVARDSADPTALMLAHDKVGEFAAVVTMSTQLATLGSDRTAAFQLPVVPAVQLKVNCPAGRHLLVNDLKLERPVAEDAAADYVIPVGNAPDVRLRWVVQQKETEAQTLVFVRTDAQLQVQKETLRWDSDSLISVFGGTINRVIARVPARLEITGVESTGLEAWTLDDDPENAGFTRVSMTYRQPFTNDRLVKIRAVAAANGTVESAVGSAMQRIPTLQFAEVTAHSGRLVVTHEDGLRLVSETGGGVRRMPAADLGLSTAASVFDFWMQSFELQVAGKPRDRELFVESGAVLAIDDTTATFDATLTVETLNAPLFELLVNLPADWQLASVEASEVSNSKSQIPVTWTNTNESKQILVRPAQPISPGQLMALVLKLSRTIADPDNEQKLTLPVVTISETTTVGGSYIVRFADDLTVAPLSLTGLTPIAGDGTEQVFQNPGTTVSGELSIVRKPARLASRSVLKTWTDSRQQSLDAEIIADVLNGTIRTLTVRLSESLGADVRFEVRSVGPVPGIQQTRAIRPVTIIEQSAGEAADGLRPFALKLDHRFAGSLSLQAFVQQPRANESSPIAAPKVQVQDAVRQQGVLVFEASPEQQLTGPQVSSIPGLFVADAGLVDAPPVATGRRVALTYRFVQTGYAFDVTETRFGTTAVPSAVCEQLANVCTLNDSGSIQRWCQAKIRSSGVQTLRFTLPGGEAQSFLWSTMLNDEPVEVRRDGSDYLVAVPTNSESQEHMLTVLFESDARQAGAFGQTDQGPVQLSIDAGELRAIPIDVLQQSWRVHYPQSSWLVDSDGQFRPTSGVDQPGWLVSLGHIVWPQTAELAEKLVPLGIFLLTLLVVTVIVIRRRWKTLAAVCVLGFVLMIAAVAPMMFGGTMYSRVTSKFAASEATESFAPNSMARSMVPVGKMDEPTASMEEFDAFAPAPGASGMGGLGGGMGGGGFGGEAVPEAAILSFNESQNAAAATTAPVDPFAAPQESPPAVVSGPESGVSGLQSHTTRNNSPNQRPEAIDLPAGDGGWIANDELTQVRVPQKGSARLSVNVNLDIPGDYRSREFVSVADAVHQPSVLSLVVQRRGQIVAIRMVAALIVILLAWRMRNAAMLWKLTIAMMTLLVALGLTPLLSNAWQSVVDGVALGALVSIAMAFVSGYLKCCVCPLTWLKSWTVSRAL